MLSKLLALSSIGLAGAANANVTALCQILLSPLCANAQFNGLPTAANQTTCEALFNGYTFLTAGDDADTGKNTIGCRQNYAMQAMTTGKASFCRYAGVTGGGMCGSVLSNTCGHILDVCKGSTMPPFADVATCTGANGLAGFAAQWGSAQGGLGSGENSLECRAYHALAGYAWGVSTTAVTDFHCNHTVANSATCTGAITTDNQHYCDTIQGACTGLPQYNSNADCMAAITAFPVGPTGGDARSSNNANDQGCRQYHSQAAVVLNNQHCTHAGPSGGYQCGNDTRLSWKYISLNAACATNATYNIWGIAVKLAFDTWAAADLAAVMPTPGITGKNYTTGSTGDNDFCRTYHCTVASTGTASALTHCEHCSIQSSQCSDPQMPAGIPAVCRMIAAGCPGTFTDVATCVAKLGPIAQARPGENNTNSPAAADTFACRAFQAGTALSSKGMGQSTTAACANVKEAAGPNCGGGGSGKSGAATLFVSVAVVLPFFMM